MDKVEVKAIIVFPNERIEFEKEECIEDINHTLINNISVLNGIEYTFEKIDDYKTKVTASVNLLL